MKRVQSKLLALLLALVLAFSLAVPAFAAPVDGVEMEGKIVILHTNDVHGAIENYAKVARAPPTSATPRAPPPWS